MKENSRKKSADLIPLIIKAVDKDSAVDVLNKTLEYLHLTSDYVTLVNLKDRMEFYQSQYDEIIQHYKSLSFPRSYQDLAQVRDELSFTYRDIQDELSFEVNKLKILFGEDRKATVRAESMISAKENEELKKTNNNKPLSLSSLDRVYGISDEYQEYMNLYALAYGLYHGLMNILASIRLMSDSVASQAAHSLTVLQKDAK